MASGPDFRRKFEFRKLLQRLSDGLGMEHLRALKNLCYDLIPKPQLEAIDSGLGVFNVLVEQSEEWEGRGIQIVEQIAEAVMENLSSSTAAFSQGQPDSQHCLAWLLPDNQHCLAWLLPCDVVSAENTAFLCELMDEIGRKDLTEDVKQYVERADAPSQNSSPYIQELDTLSLKKIASEVGREWKMLARYLGLDETTIDSIHRANFGDLQEAALQALLKWKKNAGKEATPKALKRALMEMEMRAIVHKYFEAV